MCRPVITAVAMASESHSRYVPHACLANCTSLFGPRICTCPTTHQVSNPPCAALESAKEVLQPAITPVDFICDQHSLNREDSGVDVGDSSEGSASSSADQSLDELLSLLASLKTQLALEQKCGQQETVKTRQEAESQLAQLKTDHAAELVSVNAHHAEEMAVKDEEIAKLRSELAKMRIQVEDYIVLKGNLERERQEQEAIRLAELNKQVAIPDKKNTIGAKLGRSLTRTAHKVEKDMQMLKRKFTRDTSDSH